MEENSFKRPSIKEIFHKAFKNPEGFAEFHKVDMISTVALLSMVLLVTVVMYSAISTYKLTKFIKQVDQLFQEKIPDMKISNGKLVVKDNMPVILKDKTGNLALIIDTTGEIANLDEYQQGVLMKETEIIYKENPFKTDSISLKGIEALEITKQKVKNISQRIISYSFPGFFIVLLAIKSVLLALQVFVFAALAQSMVNNSKYSFSNLVNISMYAAMVPIIIMAVIDCVLGLLFSLPDFIGKAIYFGIYIYIIYNVTRVMNKQDKEPATGEKKELKDSGNPEEKKNPEEFSY
ncbi:MAG: DUF1189 family protein [Vulcanimicrobiota bacterium]